MSNPFHAIEKALNGAVLHAVGNATLSWKSLYASGVYGVEYLDTLGMANSAPVFRCQADDLPGLATGEAVTVDYADTLVDYTVRAIEPDGTGLMRLVLEAA